MPGRVASFVVRPTILLALLLVTSALLRLVRLSAPEGSLIFDELYYVNAARAILGLPVPAGLPYADAPPGLDPNTEHPPLGKLFIAASMLAFGDNALGWRMPSVISGVGAVALLFAAVRAAGGDRWLALLAATIFSLDNLAFVHGRIATLDMPLVALLLAAAWMTLRRSYVAAGLVCGAATLVKLSGIYGLAALVLVAAAPALVSIWRTRRTTARALAAPAVLFASALVAWTAGLWLMDTRYTTYAAPWDHLRAMVDYGLSLSSERPANSESHPWQWLLNDVEMPYLRVDEQVLVNGTVTQTRPVVFFRGAMNPIVIGAAPLALAYAAWLAWRRRDRVAGWSVTWFAATYLPYFPLAMIAHRVTYIFYFLPAVPAVAVATAQLLRSSGLPRIVLWAYLAAVVVGFIGYFPFRTPW